ncbi:AAA family ATPase [Dermabacteraceae bacterium P13077]
MTHGKTFCKAQIEGLFDKWDYTITMEDDFIILHGCNGVGKTKVLEIINATNELILDQLAQLPFKKASIKYNDGLLLTVTRREKEDDSLTTPDGVSLAYLEISLLRPQSDGEKLEAKSAICEKMHEVAMGGQWRILEGSLWEDCRDGEIIEFNHLIESTPFYFEPPSFDRDSAEDSESGISKIKAELEDRKIYIIKTQRLRSLGKRTTYGVNRLPRPFRANPSRNSNTQLKIVQQSRLIRDHILEAQKESSRITQDLDREFPRKVLRLGEELNNEDKSDLDTKYKAQAKKRNRLAEVMSVKLDAEPALYDNLLDTPNGYDNWKQAVISLYLKDTDQKLQAFDSVLDRIALLSEILKDKLYDKTIKVTEQEGIEIHDAAVEDRKIPLTSLSSGEQHEIILFVDLLFNTKEGCLVLIDEPELSLHIDWQKRFVDDVRKISEVSKFNFIIATHSPDIVGDNWDHMVLLAGPDGAIPQKDAQQ